MFREKEKQNNIIKKVRRILLTKNTSFTTDKKSRTE